MSSVERRTTVAQLSGPVEYRFDRREHDTVLVFHGGHARAGLPLGRGSAEVSDQIRTFLADAP